MGWGVWHERAIVEKDEHGLHVGEVCLSCWYNQSGVEQLSVGLLYFDQRMPQFLPPFLDRLEVLAFLFWGYFHCTSSEVPNKTQVWDNITEWHCFG